MVKWWVGLEGSLKAKTVSFRVFVVVGGRGMKHGEMVKSRKLLVERGKRTICGNRQAKVFLLNLFGKGWENYYNCCLACCSR